MGLTPSTEPTPPERQEPESDGDPDIDLVAAFAIDAVDLDESVVVEALLATSRRASTDEARLRAAGAEYAVATVDVLAPPAGLRSSVLDVALARRPGSALVPATAVDLHRLEAERTVDLLERLRADDWIRPLDPPEFAGWTVQDLAAHLCSNQSLLAQLLGVDQPTVPETATTNVERTEQTLERHRTMAPALTLAEYRDFVAAVDRRIAGMTDAELDADIEWWGAPMRISTALVVRTFETWTHADDIRRALGWTMVPPPAPSLAAMSIRSLDWVPLMMVGDTEMAPTLATVRLTGPGGGEHPVQLGLEPAPDGAEPRFELEIDIVDYCRAVADRLPAGGLRYRSTGDEALAARLVERLPALAAL